MGACDSIKTGDSETEKTSLKDNPPVPSNFAEEAKKSLFIFNIKSKEEDKIKNGFFIKI